ncbi:MAG: hypothetical protein FJW40_18190 [Acidobacteria bacterium]|nr:hypothetical protein [Acidobacteriota bacterium]
MHAIVKLEPTNGTAHAMLAELAFQGGDRTGVVRHYAHASTAPEEGGARAAACSAWNDGRNQRLRLKRCSRKGRGSH